MAFYSLLKILNRNIIVYYSTRDSPQPQENMINIIFKLLLFISIMYCWLNKVGCSGGYWAAHIMDNYLLVNGMFI